MISNKLDYESSSYMHPVYKLREIPMNNNNNNLNLPQSGNGIAIFELPPDVFNLARGYLKGSVNIPADYAGGDNKCVWFYNSNLSIFDRIQVFNQAGTLLCDIPYLNFYTDTVFKSENTLDEYLTFDNTGVSSQFINRNNSNNVSSMFISQGAVDGSVNFIKSTAAVLLADHSETFVSYKASAPPNNTIIYDVKTTSDGAPVPTFTSTVEYKDFKDLNDNNLPYDLTWESVNVLTDATGGDFKINGISTKLFDYKSSGVRYDGSYPNNSYTEHEYLKHSTVVENKDNKIVNTDFKYDFILPLKSIMNSILSYDKDIYFGEKIFIKLYTAPWNNFAFKGNVTVIENIVDGKDNKIFNYDPSSGAAFLTEVKDVPITINNFSMFMAYEMTQSIRDVVMQSYEKGILHKIPFIWCDNQTFQTNNTTITQRFGAGQGKRLLRVYNTVYHPFDVVIPANLVYSKDNINNVKITKYNTMVNNVKRHDFDVDCTQNLDVMLNYDRFKTSVIQNANIYKYNYYILDDFTEDDCLYDNKSKINSSRECGISLMTDVKWDLVMTTVGAAVNNKYRNYTFSIVSRDLVLSRNMLKLV